jgi:hypothetical protein
MMKTTYKTPSDWYNANRSQLKKYRGEWIIVTNEGVVAHHENYLKATEAINGILSPYFIDRIFESDFVDPIRLLPIRFKHVKQHEWQPKYCVTLKMKSQMSVNMLVDSGADFSFIPKQLGHDLGYELAVGEPVNKAEGVGCRIDYVLRQVEMQLDSSTFTAPIAWAQTEACEEILLGREVVFDLFDIEFKQAEEKLIFKRRTIQD